MKIKCRHGHYAFEPRYASEVGRFSNYYGEPLVKNSRGFYTFSFLNTLKDYSLKTALYGNLPATETFEGEPWEVMKANGFVYNVRTKLLVPKASIIAQIDPPLVGYYFLSETPLIQAGSLNALGRKVVGFDGEYVEDNFQLRITEFELE